MEVDFSMVKFLSILPSSIFHNETWHIFVPVDPEQTLSPQGAGHVQLVTCGDWNMTGLFFHSDGDGLIIPSDEL